jgi:hypothetical protein
MLPHFMSLAVIEPVRPSYSNRVSCSLQIVGQSSISIAQQFLHNYCRSPSVAYFTFDSYSLITVVTATDADLRIVDNNRLPFCCPIIYIKVAMLVFDYQSNCPQKKKMHGTQMSEVEEDENEEGTASARSRQDGTASTRSCPRVQWSG